MFVVKRLGEIWADRDIELVSLAAIAEVDAALEGQLSLPAFCPELYPRRRFQLLKFTLQFMPASGIVQAQQDSTRKIFDYVTYQNAKGGQGPGARGNNNGRDGKRLGEFASVQAPGTAERD